QGRGAEVIAQARPAWLGLPVLAKATRERRVDQRPGGATGVLEGVAAVRVDPGPVRRVAGAGGEPQPDLAIAEHARRERRHEVEEVAGESGLEHVAGVGQVLAPLGRRLELGPRDAFG